MSILSVNHVSFSYSTSKKTVDDVSFVIEKGSYTAIVGKNGSGKSTLARLICSLLTPSSGNVQIEQNARIGLVFQSPKDQIISSVVSRDTSFGPQNLKLKPGEVELRTIECLNIVDLLEKANSSTNALSLGQTQKLALAGMLAIWPEVLILDEAVAMLDPETRQNVYEFLRYWHKSGNTILHITHDMEAIEEADNIIGMEDGKVFYYGTKDAFMKNADYIQKIKGPELPPAIRKVDANQTSTARAVSSFSMKDVTFHYNVSDKKSCVKNINFSLKKGTLTALTGPSGSGKSTILELGAGLLAAESGIINGVCRPSLVQQNSSAALFEAFAADDVAFGPRNQGLKGKALKERVKQSMEMAYLPFDTFGERQTTELSGGEKRRLAIAGILALDSEVVFFDEPTAGLDGHARFYVMTMLKKLAENGKTVLFSTHQKDEAVFADREIKVQEGKITFDSFEQVLSDEQIKELKVYETTSMLAGLRAVNVGISGANKQKKTPVEKLPSVLRILLFLTLFILSLIVKNLWLCVAMLGVSVLYCKLSGFKLRKLGKAALKILPFLLFFTILQLIFHPALPDEVRYTTWKWFMITPSKIKFCIASILRTDATLACISGFFVSIPEYDLIDGLKLILKPLELIKIPVRYFILIVEIIFRFIPLLTDEAVSIIKTQIIRGGFGKVKGVFGKIKAIIPLMVPLIIRTIRRSEALADAITMRGFE